MTRPWSTAAHLLAACAVTAWAAAACADGEPHKTTSLRVVGQMVDPDIPATYRLPLVKAPPLPEERIAMQDGVHSVRQPQSSPQQSTPPPPADTTAPAVPIATAALPELQVYAVQQFALPMGPIFAQPIESAPAAVAAPAQPTDLTTQLLPAVQRGYKLAQRGALFAARTEFVQVLRRVAQAKDSAGNTDAHSRALAAGLRALDEAGDFVPDGIQLEAELDVRAVASSHRTLVLRDHPKEALPHEAALLYHEFAKERLSAAAAGEQAGSMALYGIGKVYTRMAERRDDDVECVRSATTMYAAALAACPENHLAANELGVMLCKAGRPQEAIDQFEHTIDASPTATAYHNLAVAQQKAGLQEAATANERQSQRLAVWERSTNAVSRRARIEWVSPAEMAAVGQPTQWEPTTSSALNRAAPPPASATSAKDPASRPLIFPSVMPARAQLR